MPRFSEDRLSAASAGQVPWALVILMTEALLALWFALWALHRAPVAEAAGV